MAKLIFDIKEHSKVTGKEHVAYIGCTYTIDNPKSNAVLIHEAEAWAFKQVKFFAGITNLKLEDVDLDYHKDDSIILIGHVDEYIEENGDDVKYDLREGIQEYNVYNLADGDELLVEPQSWTS